MLKDLLDKCGGGLKQGEVLVVGRGATNPLRYGSIPYDKQGYMGNDPRMYSTGLIISHERDENIYIGNKELYPYYVHNMFRILFGIERIYNYDICPVTKFEVEDLALASRGIDHFKYQMRNPAHPITFKINKQVFVKDGKTKAVVELIILDAPND